MFSVPEQFHASRIRRRVLIPTRLLDAVAALALSTTNFLTSEGLRKAAAELNSALHRALSRKRGAVVEASSVSGGMRFRIKHKNECADAREGLGSRAGGQQIVALPETCSEEGNYVLAFSFNR